MTDHIDDVGRSGFARVATADGPVVVHTDDHGATFSAAVLDGGEFDDLPGLIEACGGEVAAIGRGRAVDATVADLVSPIARPRKIICLGQNYLAHVQEGGRAAAPSYPDLFPKWDNAISGPRDDIELPAESDHIDYESELAFVIGRRCRRVSPEQVADVVFGYTAANDGSVRDFQFHTTQRVAGKAWDRLTPLGPIVVPAALLGGAAPDLRIVGRFDGQTVQDDRTSSMVFDVRAIVAYVSTIMTLEPGDVVLTGTPSGVGFVREPQLLITDGTVFEVAIEGIGTLRNRFVGGPNASPSV